MKLLITGGSGTLGQEITNLALAKKYQVQLYQKEFKKWFQLTTELVPLLKFFRQIEITIPTYYIMGDQDYMFLPSVKELVKAHKKSLLFVIPNCGHVVNVDKPNTFNSKMFEFLNNTN